MCELTFSEAHRAVESSDIVNVSTSYFMPISDHLIKLTREGRQPVIDTHSGWFAGNVSVHNNPKSKGLLYLWRTLDFGKSRARKHESWLFIACMDFLIYIYCQIGDFLVQQLSRSVHQIRSRCARPPKAFETASDTYSIRKCR